MFLDPQDRVLDQASAFATAPATAPRNFDDLLRAIERTTRAPAAAERGLLEPGNVDLTNRPRVPNGDGYSTVLSKSWNFDGREVLLPTVSDDGRLMSDEEAKAQYQRTGRHLGIFDTPENANAYAQRLHEDQARLADFKPSAEALRLARPDKNQARDLLDNLAASYRETWKTGVTGARSAAFAEAYDDVLQTLNQGRTPEEQLPNPYGPALMSGESEPTPVWQKRIRAAQEHGQRSTEVLEGQIWAAIAEGRRTDPGRYANLPETREAMIAKVHAQYQGYIDRAAGVRARSSVASSALLGSFLGGAAAATGDPVNIAAMGLGSPAASTLLRTFLVEGSINAGAELLTLPEVRRWRAELGRPMTTEEEALQVGGAFLLGGGVAAGVKALAGRGLVEAFDKRVPDPPPAARTARQDVLDAADRAEENPLTDDPASQAQHTENLILAQTAGDAGAPLDAPQASAVARPYDAKLEAARRRSGFVVRVFEPSELTLDAATMQYKRGGDVEGVTDRLAGVKEWDPVKGGLIVVWERQDGRLITADGHQRTGLAKRIAAEGGEAPIAGMVFREADGWTASEMRIMAAMRNIAEGSGEALDAARILREAPEGVAELPPRSPLVKKARDLLALNDEAWGMVWNGMVPERDAALVGALVKDPKLQTAILDFVAKSEPETAEEAEIIIRQALAAGARQEVQTDMFGAMLSADLILPERIAILKASLTQLRRDKALFNTLTKRENVIAEAGNVLNVAENAKRQEFAARAFGTLKALAERKGPISDALQAAAEKSRASKNRRGAIGDFIAAVRRAVDEGLLDRAADDGAGSAAPAVDARPDAGRPGELKEELSLFGDPAGKPEAFTAQTKTIAREVRETAMHAIGVADRIPPPPRTELSDMSTGDLGAMMGEIPGWEDWAFDLLDDVSVARLRALSDAEKAKALEGDLRAVAGENIFIEALADDMRVSRWDGEKWNAAGLGEHRSAAVERVQALYIDAKGNRSVTVEEFNRLAWAAWLRRHPGVEQRPVEVPSAANDAENPFGEAAPEIAALRSLADDEAIPAPAGFGAGDDGVLTVKDVRKTIETEAKFVERMRACTEE